MLGSLCFSSCRSYHFRSSTPLGCCQPSKESRSTDSRAERKTNTYNRAMNSFSSFPFYSGGPARVFRFCIVRAFTAVGLVCTTMANDDVGTKFTDPLPTGVRLDPVGDAIELGSVPLGMAVAPGGDKVAVVLSGWREQGLQIVDLKSLRVTQTLEQPAAFLGVAFARDGKALYVSGGNDDSIFCYAWENGAAKFARKIVLGQQKPDKTGSRYPAGLAISPRGNYLYVAENVGDDVAVVDPRTQQVVGRLPTDHYPYAVEVASDGKVYVSAGGADNASLF